MQWRPAPLYLVPGSLDYENRKNTDAWPWMPFFISPSNREALKSLRQELSDIPYEFARSIPDEVVGSILKKIQNADRQAGFVIGGIAAHAIKEVAETRRNRLQSKKLARVGVATQRYEVV